MYSIVRNMLFALPAETSHKVSLGTLDVCQRMGMLEPMFRPVETKPCQVMGISFPNPVGLAAGLDKNGDHIDALASLGFGFIEIGTVTPRPQPGNPQPRLFRLPQASAIINRMGFNNKGIDYLIERVKSSSYRGVLGINIGKNFDTPVANAVNDYLIGMRKSYAHASYITVNLSSPNTPGLRDLQFGEPLEALLASLKEEQTALAQEHGRYVPVAVKIAPDMVVSDIAAVAGALRKYRIDAVIATNTTIDKSAVEGLPHGAEAGGLSGLPVREKSTKVIAELKKQLANELPIIGVGGVMQGEDAREKQLAGADLVQIYSGFIYAGPSLIKSCVKAWK